MNVAITALSPTPDSRVDPDFFGAHNLLGGMMARANMVNQAIREYREALAGNPSPAGVYSNLGNAYMSTGDYSSAIDNFRRAIGLDSTLVNAYIGMGLTYEAMGDADTAISLFRRARSVDPSAQPAYHAEVAALLGKDQHETATGLAREGLSRWPDSALLLSDLGLAFLRSGILDSAVVYLEAAVQHDPQMLSARGNLAVALERKGLEGRAIEQYRIYLEIAPPGGSRDLAVRALERLIRRAE